MVTLTDTFAKICLIGLVVLVQTLKSDERVLGRGFGDDYAWWSFDRGLEESRATGKPVTPVRVLCDQKADHG
jgi:hypothetical protein